MDSVRVIERSLRCFVTAWFGLVPLLGVVPAVIALHLFHQVQDEVGENWNPARAYAIGGCVLAWCGLGVTMLAVLAPLLRVLF